VVLKNRGNYKARPDGNRCLKFKRPGKAAGRVPPPGRAVVKFWRTLSSVFFTLTPAVLASVGVVFKRDKFGSMIQVQRIEGKLFENKKQAEQHGVELCKDWIDKGP
jgi:hypothetical protein